MKEITVLKDINEASSGQILMWTQRVEAQRAQKEVLDHVREDGEFHSIRWDKHKCDNAGQNKNRVIKKCKYCGTGHPLRQCPAYGKMCGGCSNANHFKVACRSAQWQGLKLIKNSKSVHVVKQDE